MALVDFMTEPDKAQSWERRKEAVVAKLAGATRTEAALVIADKGYNLRDMLRAAATSQASVDSTNRQENLVAGVEARGNLGAGESDLSDRDLAVTRLATRRVENPNPVPGTLAAKRIERHDNAGSKGGSDRHWNRVAACRACNRSKDDTPLETWLAGDTPSGNDINAVATDSTPRTGWPTPAPPATSICRTGAPATPTPASGPEGRLMLETWTDGVSVQVIGLDGEGQIVLAREGTLTDEATLEGTGAIEGRLPAGQLEWVRGTELAYERCATPDCARAIATRAESIVRAWQMGVAEGADKGSIMAKLCPAPQAEEAHAHTPTDALAALAAEQPCKWRPVALEDLAPMPGVGRRTLVQIGTTVHELRQARWLITPDPR